MDLVSYLAVGLALATASVTLTRARLFEPLRTWLEGKNWLLYKFASCPYCMGHWLALWLVPFTLGEFTSNAGLNVLVTWFFLAGLTALFEGLIMKGLLMQENRILELEADIEAQDKFHIAHLNAMAQAHRVEQDQWVREGMRQERERFAAMDIALRTPITPD